MSTTPTDAQRATVKALVQSNIKPREIAVSFGVPTRWLNQHYANELGKTPKIVPLHPNLTDMQRMQDEGYGNNQIAKRFGVTRQRVNQMLGPKPRDYTPKFNTDNLADPFAKALVTWRMRYDLTQIEAAQILHLKSVTTYSKWERGLGCSLSALVLDFLKLWEHAYHTREIRT